MLKANKGAVQCSSPRSGLTVKTSSIQRFCLKSIPSVPKCFFDAGCFGPASVPLTLYVYNRIPGDCVGAPAHRLHQHELPELFPQCRIKKKKKKEVVGKQDSASCVGVLAAVKTTHFLFTVTAGRRQAHHLGPPRARTLSAWCSVYPPHKPKLAAKATT